MVRLPEHEWRALEAAHEARVDALTAGHRGRRDRGERHPVVDFVFDYYGHTPAKLRRWYPGPGVALESAAGEPRASWAHMRVEREAVVLDEEAYLAARGRAIGFIRALLARTLARPAQTGCFGLHEWAMVYRQPDERRHQAWPPRLGRAGTDAVLASSTLRCTHADAARFFTADAVPRNIHAPTRATQLADEQPGCLHAGMDLYRWAFKLAPGMPSTLILEGFELAMELRVLDMRASPYDLRALGYEPVPVETADGRREYAEHQRAFAERGNALRVRLLEALDAYPATLADRAAPGAGRALRQP